MRERERSADSRGADENWRLRDEKGAGMGSLTSNGRWEGGRRAGRTATQPRVLSLPMKATSGACGHARACPRAESQLEAPQLGAAFWRGFWREIGRLFARLQAAA
eukprot:662079-Pleurochrysis_carterae.AAC.3